jgi:hypothetical protein
MIKATGGNLHWNYLIALERDLEVASRYVEFCKPNYDVYSIEFAHLLFAAASEVDTVAKLLCERLQPDAPRRNIDDYRAVLVATVPDLPTTQVFVPRYGLTLTPWANWSVDANPFWWGGYNRVKHQRDAHFHEATLHNALNALGALLILTFHHYSYELVPSGAPRLSQVQTTNALRPETTLLRFPSNFYYQHLVFET